MTLQLDGMGPLDRLQGRLPAPVFGFDPGTKRFAAGVLTPLRNPDRPVRPFGETVTLKQHDHLGMRQVLAVDVLVGWLRELEARYGQPGLIGLEMPMGSNVELPFFFAIGAFYVAVGQTWGAAVPVRTLTPTSWKKTATGHGIAPGAMKLAPKVRRAGELARVLRFAKDAGYTGESVDEAAGIGVAVAVALKALGR